MNEPCQGWENAGGEFCRTHKRPMRRDAERCDVGDAQHETVERLQAHRPTCPGSKGESLIGCSCNHPGMEEE